MDHEAAPCPFCGEDYPEIEAWLQDPDVAWASVTCTRPSCGARVYGHEHPATSVTTAHQQALSRWNRRPLGRKEPPP